MRFDRTEMALAVINRPLLGRERRHNGWRAAGYPSAAAGALAALQRGDATRQSREGRRSGRSRSRQHSAAQCSFQHVHVQLPIQSARASPDRRRFGTQDWRLYT